MTRGLAERTQSLADPVTGRSLLVPLDHGLSDGPVNGLKSFELIFGPGGLLDQGINGVIVHKGVAGAFKSELEHTPFLVHLSASTSLNPNPRNALRKVLIGTPEEAERLGATGVSVHVNLGNEHEGDMLRDLGAVVDQAHRREMTVLVMMYVRDVVNGKVHERKDADAVAHAARVGAECGADIIKVSYTGSPTTFRQVVEGCFRPVMIAGGGNIDDALAARNLTEAVMVGGRGATYGRNIFANANRKTLLFYLSNILSLTPSLYPSPQFGDTTRTIFEGMRQGMNLGEIAELTLDPLYCFNGFDLRAAPPIGAGSTRGI